MRFILGGEDTEMIEIAKLLAKTDYSVVYATIKGSRVNRSEAYEATLPTPKAFDVWVECTPSGYTKQELFSLGVDLVDHHHEGDVGYSMPASKYWEASSIGQVCTKIGLRKTPRLSYIAAADHCLLAAYHEQCPGISRQEFIDFRMKFFKTYTNEPFTHLRTVYDKALTCDTVEIGTATVYDITDMLNTDKSWLSDMACCWNLKTISIRQKKNRFKLFVSNLSSSDIEYFTNEYVPGLGVVISTYGDPKRQFAGAIIEGEYVSKNR